jgi:hypothetical protein
VRTSEKKLYLYNCRTRLYGNCLVGDIQPIYSIPPWCTCHRIFVTSVDETGLLGRWNHNTRAACQGPRLLIQMRLSRFTSNPLYHAGMGWTCLNLQGVYVVAATAREKKSTVLTNCHRVHVRCEFVECAGGSSSTIPSADAALEGGTDEHRVARTDGDIHNSIAHL